MKNYTLLVTLALLLSITGIKAQSYSENFDAYTPGQYLGVVSSSWSPWSGASGGASDVLISNTDAYSGSNSVYFKSVSSSGGPTDMVLSFGSTYTMGAMEYQMYMKVENNKGAYFNFQGNATNGDIFTLQCQMDQNGDLVIGAPSVVLETTYAHNTWFKLSFTIDLNTNTWELFIDDVSKGVFYTENVSLAGLNVYPVNASNGQSGFWIDDVAYHYTPYIASGTNGAVTAVINPGVITGQWVIPTIQIRNLGLVTINSFDLTINYNGITVAESFSGNNISSMAFSEKELSNLPLEMVMGSNAMTAIISNINGNAADDVADDDSKTIFIDPVVAAEGKMVVAEEATGTWCGWCPRGAVMMEYMSEHFPHHFAGIAVHNDDPMENVAYDAGLGNLINGYPSAVVDRESDIDPGDILREFLPNIQQAPAAFMENSFTYDSITRKLVVSVKTTYQKVVNNQYKIACALTENNVTGTTSGYAQSNYYAGGGSGIMGGYEVLPSKVPASQMVYQDVARIILPSFTGTTGTLPSSASIGDVFVNEFTFTLDGAWDQNQMYFVSILINQTGRIENADRTKITPSVFPLSVKNSTSGIDQAFQLGPNPAGDWSYARINLKTDANTELHLFDALGKRVAYKNYGLLNGAHDLLINTGVLNPGMYLVTIVLDGEKMSKKIIVE